MMKKYAVGFAFSRNGNTLLLIEKKSPSKQAGLLNGIGGKVEPGEEFLTAQVREFEEETGVLIPADQWRWFAKLTSTGWEVHCYVAFTDAIWSARQTTIEELHFVATDFYMPPNIVPNLSYLIPLAKDQSCIAPVPDFVYSLEGDRT